MKKAGILTIFLLGIFLIGFVSASTNITDTLINTTGLYYGNGSQITGILGSQINNDFSWVNWTSLSQFTNDLGIGNFSAYVQPTHLTNFTNDLNIGNWSADKPSYSTWANQTATFLPLTGGTLSGSLIINGNLTLIGSYFQANVTNQILNGSFTPSLDSLFDIGSSTAKWKNGIFSGDLNATNLNGNLDFSYIQNFPYNNNLNFTNGAGYTTNVSALSFVNSSGYVKDWNSTGYIKNWTPEINSANTSLYNWIVGQGYTVGGITWANAVNGTLALTSDLSSYATNVKVDSLGNWSADKGSYSTTSQANGLYYGIGNSYGFYNITTAPTYVNDTFGANYSNYLTLFNWNKTYADTLYQPIGSYLTSESDPLAYNGTLAYNSSLANYYLNSNPNSYYNSTDFSINDYYTKTNIDGFNFFNNTNFPYTSLSNFTDDLGDRGYTSLSNFTNDQAYIDWSKAVNGTLALASSVPTNNNQLTNGNNYWNSTFATFNKTYADTLYQPTGSYLTSESDPFWSGNYSNYLTLFNWNKTYADTLYYDIGNSANYINWANAINGTLAKTTDLSAYALTSSLSTVATSGAYSDLTGTPTIPTNNNQLTNGNSYYNSTTIPSYMPSAYATNNTFYPYSGNPSGFLTTETNWNGNYSSFLTKIDWSQVTNGTLALTSSLSSYATNTKVDSLGNWSADKPSYSTTSQANALYYGIGNSYGYYNSTTIPSYATWSQVVNGTVALTSDLSSYYLSSNPSGYIDWSQAVNGTLALASNIPTSNSQLTNGNNYYNSTNPQTETDPVFVAQNSSLAHKSGGNTFTGTQNVTGNLSSDRYVTNGNSSIGICTNSSGDTFFGYIGGIC